MDICCSGLGCNINSVEACMTLRPKLYYHQGQLFCERHYLQNAGMQNERELVWDYNRGYSGMFPQANNAGDALDRLGQSRLRR